MSQLLLWLQLLMRASGHDSTDAQICSTYMHTHDRHTVKTHDRHTVKTHDRHTVKTHALITCAQLRLELPAVLSSTVV